MARGSNNDDKKLFYAKIMGLKKEWTKSPYIEISQKQGDKYVEIDKCSFIEGNISKAKIGSYEYEGREKKTIELTIEDNEEKYILQSSYNQLSRSLINSLLGASDYSNVKISVYTNKAGYKSIYVEGNGAKMPWKYTVDEFKAKTDAIKNKKGETVSVDYSELDNWLEQEFQSHVIPNCKSISYAEKAPSTTSVAESTEEPKPLTGKAKTEAAAKLKAELDKKNGTKSFIQDDEDPNDLPF